jgi:hypothetical protein
MEKSRIWDPGKYPGCATLVLSQDPDPAKKFCSERIRIQNTVTIFTCNYPHLTKNR